MPRSITTDTVIGPVIRPKLLDGRGLPEIHWRYDVEDEVVTPYVAVFHTLRSRLVIPVQWAKIHIDEALGHTADVEAADKPVVVGDTVSLQYLFHTSALVMFGTLNKSPNIRGPPQVWNVGRGPIPPPSFRV